MKPYRNDIVPISDGFISINDNDVPILTITDNYTLCFSGNIRHFRVAGCLFERRRFFKTLCSTAGHIILFLSKPLGLVLSLALRSWLDGNFFLFVYIVSYCWENGSPYFLPNLPVLYYLWPCWSNKCCQIVFALIYHHGVYLPHASSESQSVPISRSAFARPVQANAILIWRIFSNIRYWNYGARRAKTIYTSPLPSKWWTKNNKRKPTCPKIRRYVWDLYD